MNKIFVFFSLFLVASMGFVAAPNPVHADSQLDILVKITQNTKEHIKNDIDKLGSTPQKIIDLYNDGTTKTALLLQAVENDNVALARQHFISAMVAFKQASLAISENQPQVTILDHGSLIKKYEANIQKLKAVSTKLGAGVDFQKIDHLLALAKANNTDGKLEQAKDVLNEVATEGKQIQKLLYDISEQNRILKAKQFVQKHAERINQLIIQAKTFGLDKTADELTQSQVELLQANSTSKIKQQFKIIIIHQQKVQQVKETNQAEISRLQSLLVPLENKAQSLANDVKGNDAAEYFLKKAFSLIEKTKQDINDLAAAPSRIGDYKYLDLTIGKNFETIKDLLMKIEKLIYISS